MIIFVENSQKVEEEKKQKKEREMPSTCRATLISSFSTSSFKADSKKILARFCFLLKPFS